ncbi:MAG: hypothetical protein M1823_008378, partial [Watsoniomyces obsoletus]
FTIIDPALEPIHESHNLSTGLAVYPDLDFYLTYSRNTGLTPVNVALATSFTHEEPWPSAEIQNCTAGQHAFVCFINVQNVVLDSVYQMWISDSRIPPGNKSAVTYGAKIMLFDLKSKQLLRTYVIPEELFYDGMNPNDVPHQRRERHRGHGSGGLSLMATELHPSFAVHPGEWLKTEIVEP